MGYAKPLTESYFNKFVENRKNKKEIWVVMLHTEGNKMSEELYPKFIKASNLADGIFKFGVVNTKRTPLIARKFNVKSVPSFFVFHEEGKTEYLGDCEPEDLIDFCSEYLFDYSKPFDETWYLNQSSIRTSAALFTRAQHTPNLWLGISNLYHSNRRIRIGLTRNETLFKAFNVTDPPKIVFFNKTMNYTYKGKTSFRAISRELNNFIEGQLKLPGAIPEEVLDASEFTKHCVGGLHTCILYTSGKDMMGWNRLHEKYQGIPMIWFSGHKDLPWKFLKEGSFWIYNPQGDFIIKIDNMSDVGPVLERILKGQEIWGHLDDFLNKESENSENGNKNEL